MKPQLQILDIEVRKPLKEALWRNTEKCRNTENIRTCNNMDGDRQSRTNTNRKLKKPSVSEPGEWILMAWSKISTESSIKDLKRVACSTK